MKDPKAKQKWASSSRKSIKTQSKYISKDQVHKSEIKQIYDSPVSFSEKSSPYLCVQSYVDSVKAVFQVQVGWNHFRIFSEYDGKIVPCPSESKSHITSPSSQCILSEPSLFFEEKSEVSSLTQRHSYSEVSTFTEKELQKVLEIAPFLDRTLMTEEDIAYILLTFEKNRDYFTSLQSRQYPVDFPSHFTA